MENILKDYRKYIKRIYERYKRIQFSANFVG